MSEHEDVRCCACVLLEASQTSSRRRTTNTGVVVGAPSPKTDAQYGKITSGGNGVVTVTGYGGTVVAPATPDYVSSNNFLQCSGVFTSGSDAMITSGGAGKVTVSGTGGGPASNNTGSVGVSVYGTANGGILGGPGASVEVTGRGSEAAGSGCRDNYGVYVFQGKIKAGVGAGTTRVTGYGGYPATGTGFNYGIRLHTSATITSDGSGSVTVIGHGANAGNNNAGIHAQSLSSISSGGGEVRVEGNGGGSGGGGSGTFCHGITVNIGSFITAGGTGNVTVIGRGGNNLSATAGNSNHGVQITSFGSGQTPGYIISSGGNVTVEWSDTLAAGSWSTQAVTEQITATQGALETVKASVPKGNGGKRFLRLKVQAVSGN